MHKSSSSSCSVGTFNGNINQLQLDHIRHRTTLCSTSVHANGDDRDYDASPVNYFQPRTMTVSESFAYFARLVVQTILDKRAQIYSGGNNRRRLRNRIKNILRKGKRDIQKESTKAKAGVWESLCKLNESRKSLIQLVGYDSSLLVPAFTFLTLGALMSSIIPHYYSACISYVVVGEANRDKLLWALGGLGMFHEQWRSRH